MAMGRFKASRTSRFSFKSLSSTMPAEKRRRRETKKVRKGRKGECEWIQCLSQPYLTICPLATYLEIRHRGSWTETCLVRKLKLLCSKHQVRIKPNSVWEAKLPLLALFASHPAILSGTSPGIWSTAHAVFTYTSFYTHGLHTRPMTSDMRNGFREEDATAILFPISKQVAAASIIPELYSTACPLNWLPLWFETQFT